MMLNRALSRPAIKVGLSSLLGRTIDNTLLNVEVGFWHDADMIGRVLKVC
jgi:hypothetical protein